MHCLVHKKPLSRKGTLDAHRCASNCFLIASSTPCRHVKTMHTSGRCINRAYHDMGSVSASITPCGGGSCVGHAHVSACVLHAIQQREGHCMMFPNVRNVCEMRHVQAQPCKTNERDLQVWYPTPQAVWGRFRPACEHTAVAWCTVKSLQAKWCSPSAASACMPAACPARLLHVASSKHRRPCIKGVSCCSW